VRIIFIGTPEFACPALATLHKSAHDVIGVVTVPDKQQGRGRQHKASPIKRLAEELQLPLWQPQDLQAEAYIEELKMAGADLFVVVAFRILPEELFELPRLGAINLHASLLPAYRGAAPIQRAIMAGEKETGLSIFRLARSVDSGDIYAQMPMPIGDNTTAGELHDNMMQSGAVFLLQTIDAIASGQAQLSAQDKSRISRAPKIFGEDARIDWLQPAETVHNLIRAMDPYPGATARINGETVKLYASRYHADAAGQAGDTEFKENELLIFCASGAVGIRALQRPGRKRLAYGEFCRGINQANYTNFDLAN
jgi:methionyl-tRNA formyltransferase